MRKFGSGSAFGFPRSRSPDPQEQESALRTWLASIVLILAGYGYIIYHHQWTCLWAVVISIPPIWVVIGVVALTEVWWWWTRKEFSAKELLLFVLFSAFFAYPATALGFW